LTREEVVEMAGDDELLFADGFDDCIIGLVRIFNKTVVLYDQTKCLRSLVRRSQIQDASEEDLWENAVEFFEFNVVGAYVGEKTPAYAVFPEKE